MTAALDGRRVSRSIAWRLAVGASPSILTVGLVVGLFYYGEIGREAPRVLLGGRVCIGDRRRSRLPGRTRGTSPIASGDWRERPIRRPRAASAADEFDRIEQAVGDMGSALSAAEAERARTNAIAAEQLRDQATMLAGVVGDSLAQLDEVRLPLHILLESRFGDLNENQEELLRDARAAADAIDVALRRLGQLAEAIAARCPCSTSSCRSTTSFVRCFHSRARRPSARAHESRFRSNQDCREPSPTARGWRRRWRCWLAMRRRCRILRRHW